MNRYEITFESVNTEVYSKPITARVIAPDKMDSNTGSMLFTHGWAGNRFQNQDQMEYAAVRYNLVCISVEFRMSGYDFNPVTGRGACQPYDGSFMQVFDVLNGLRSVLSIMPGINRHRLFSYGGSQGGWIALLGSIFAPDTFAMVYASSPVTFFEAFLQQRCAREFSDWEISIRSVIEHAEMINCPVFLEHGTNDEALSHIHTRRLEGKLNSLNKPVKATYYEGGSHSLEPTTTRFDSFKATASEPMATLTTDCEDDFSARRIVEIPCGQKTLVIDWSKPADCIELFSWK